MMVLSDWTLTVEEIFSFGYVYTGFILTILALNMFFVIMSSISDCIRAILLRCKRYRIKEQEKANQLKLIEDCRVNMVLEKLKSEALAGGAQVEDLKFEDLNLDQRTLYIEFAD